MAWLSAKKSKSKQSLRRKSVFARFLSATRNVLVNESSCPGATVLITCSFWSGRGSEYDLDCFCRAIRQYFRGLLEFLLRPLRFRRPADYTEKRIGPLRRSWVGISSAGISFQDVYLEFYLVWTRRV